MQREAYVVYIDTIEEMDADLEYSGLLPYCWTHPQQRGTGPRFCSPVRVILIIASRGDF